VKHFGLAVGP